MNYGAIDVIDDCCETQTHMSCATVLMVDPDSKNVSLWTERLAGRGVDVIPAASPAAALVHLSSKDKNIQVILADHQLPEMKGLELLKEVRERGYTTPIIVLSSDFTLTESQVVIRGAAELIYKPAVLIDVVHAIKGAIRKAAITAPVSKIIPIAR